MGQWKSVVCVVMNGVLAGCSPDAGPSPATDVQDELFALERDSHQLWLESHLDGLDSIMADGFLFVAMNGAVETKALVLGREEGAAPAGERPLRVNSLQVTPEELELHGTSAVVISLMHLDASVRGRPLPDRMRVLSVFDRDNGQGWRLIARSITPILSAPADQQGADPFLSFHFEADAGEAPSISRVHRATGEAMALRAEAIIDVTHLASAHPARAAVFGHVVMVEFTPAGVERLSRATEANLGRRLAIVVDGVIVMAPVVRSRIGPGSAQLAAASAEEAQQLADRITAAAGVRDGR